MTTSRKLYEDTFRTPFEAFGHNENCEKWKETDDSYSLDPFTLCTCGGRELSPDAVDGCDCITSGNAKKPKQHSADPHAKNCRVYTGALPLKVED